MPSRIKIGFWVTLIFLFAIGCTGTSPIQAPAPVVEPSPSEMTEDALLYVLSNSSPHVSVIDTATNQVIDTLDVPDFTAWGWNDDNNYFDGENIWLGLRDPDTNAAEIIALNLDTLSVTSRLAIGEENMTLYIGKATADGLLLVGKMGAGQVAVIDTSAFEVRDIWDVPVSGDVVCDADVATGTDGIERFYYPTRKGNTLISIDAHSGETNEIVDTPEGSTPLMLTTAPDNSVWVQEVDANTNAVFDPVTLELKTRFLTGQGPIVASFSTDGQYGFIGHNKDTLVTVIDTESLQEIQRIQVGTNPQKLAIHPAGQYFYAILTKEAAVAVLSTESWEVTDRIELGTNPNGIFIRSDS